jgi:sugar transferase (PEP-CTERM/EpsH1 system associated)
VDILLLTPQPPFPPHQGTAIRNWGILRHLARRHSITLLSFAPSGSPAPVPELAAACRSVELVPLPARGLGGRLRTAASGQADMAERLWSPDFARAIRRVLETSRFDLVQVEGLELGRYIESVRRSHTELPVVYDAHNAEFAIQERAWRSDRQAPRRWAAAVYSRLQMARLARFEADVCHQATAVTCVSDADAAALGKMVPGLQLVLVPNGIELDEYLVPGAEVRDDANLTFTGKMDYRPNVDAALWFAEKILPRIRERRPAARFQVVGQKPATKLARKDGQNGVAVIGAVPDTRPYIAKSAVVVAPLRMGGGTRFKLLEAMALGRPVVSTAIGAEGFAVQSGRELLIADTAEDFARAVLRILDDPGLARQIGQAGRAFVAAGSDWTAIIPRLEALHRRLVVTARLQPS